MNAVVQFPDPRGQPAPVPRPPPANAEAEQALLGAVLVNNAAFHAIGPRLLAEHFSEEIHQRIWTVATALITEGRVATPITLRTFLGDHDLGGITVPQYLARLAAEATTIVNAPDYARMVVDLATRRALIAAAEEVIEGAYDPPAALPVERLVDGAEASLMAVRQSLAATTQTRVTAADAAGELLDQVQRIMNGEEQGVGVTTGLRDLDYDTGGMRPGELWVVGGRVGMGKTIKAITLARAAAKSGVGVLLFPFEIGRRQAIARVLSDLAYFHRKPLGYGAIMKGQVDAEDMWRLRDAEKRLRDMPLVLDDSSGATLTQIASRIRSERDRMAKRGVTLGVVILDYLKFIKAGDRYAGQRVNEVGEITVGLKRMAKDLNVCIVLLAQVNRGTESRDDKRPNLADLRESGDIESDADVVLFVYRDIYYIERTKKFNDGDPDTVSRANDCRDELELIVAKLRTGATRTHKLWCDVSCSTIATQSRRGL